MIGFVRPPKRGGGTFTLIGSHYSTVRKGRTPFIAGGCAGCAAQGIEARQGGDSEASSIGDESPAGEAGVPNG